MAAKHPSPAVSWGCSPLGPQSLYVPLELCAAARCPPTIPKLSTPVAQAFNGPPFRLANLIFGPPPLEAFPNTPSLIRCPSQPQTPLLLSHCTWHTVHTWGGYLGAASESRECVFIMTVFTAAVTDYHKVGGFKRHSHHPTVLETNAGLTG